MILYWTIPNVNAYPSITFLEHATYCIFFGHLDSPRSTVLVPQVFPHGSPVASHQVVRVTQRQFGNIGYVIVHWPKALNSWHTIDFPHISFVFSRCCSSYGPGNKEAWQRFNWNNASLVYISYFLSGNKWNCGR